MTEKEFVEYIGPKAKLDYQKHGILASITAAQACLESGYGSTELAKNANNFFGMKKELSGNKWKTVWDGKSIYKKKTQEEYVVGNIVTITAEFRKYPSIDLSIEDHSLYLTQATNGSKLRYEGLVGCKDYRKAIQIIKNGGYATDSKYVDKICSLIERWNLTQYDEEVKKPMGYTNSPLATVVVKSPNHSGKRTHKIDTITPHCVVGQIDAKTIGSCFTSSAAQASCNYGIGKDGKVVLCVDESNRSWCTSSNSNDQRAVTIECASDKTTPYAFTNTVYNKLIDLCVDICQRNGIKKLLWLGSKEKTLSYTPKDGEAVLTAHRWFAAKECPGDWMYAREGDLASKVTARLGGNAQTPTKIYYYRVRKTWKNEESQLGAYELLENAKDNCPIGYSVFDEKGKAVYTNKKTQKVSELPYQVKITADTLNIREGAGTDYAVVGTIKDKGIYTITKEKNGFGKLKSNVGWISLKYTKKI